MKFRIVEMFGDLRSVAREPAKRWYGVPLGGPYDNESCQVAKILSGDLPRYPLELANGQVTIEAITNCYFVVAGATDLAGGRFVQARDHISITVNSSGMRAYICSPSRPGGAIEKGCVFECETSPRVHESFGVSYRPASLHSQPLVLHPGPQASMFDLRAIHDTEYTVDNSSNRMGLRLRGDALPGAEEIRSEPTSPGVVQIVGDGQPIVLGPDAPTVGGYPKIGWIPRRSIDRCGQLRPGDRVRFAVVANKEEEDRIIDEYVPETRDLSLDAIRIAVESKMSP